MNKEEINFCILGYPNNFDKSSINNGLVYVADNWNDYNYYTLFHTYIVIDGQVEEIGMVNIATFSNIESPYSTLELVNEDGFEEKVIKEFPKNYFVLGNQNYYSKLKEKFTKRTEKISDVEKVIYEKTNDVIYNDNYYQSIKYYEVTEKSLFRNIRKENISIRVKHLQRYLFQKIAFINFNAKFTYYFKNGKEYSLNINTNKNSLLPTNVFALIGNNGAGKTSILKDIAVLLGADKEDQQNCNFRNAELLTVKKDNDEFDFISEVVFISYSSFDTFNNDFTEAIQNNQKLHFVGNRECNENIDLNKIETINELSKDLGIKILSIYRNSDLKAMFDDVLNNFSWDNQIQTFFKNVAIQSEREDKNKKEKDMQEIIEKEFKKMSSGQKIILLTLISIIYYSEDNAFFLLDEPELYLHPPYVLALINTISQIMEIRNSICILTTHSPIVLQEIIKKNIFLIKRNNLFGHPHINTYGADLGEINDEIYGVDTRNTGFYSNIKNIVKNQPDSIDKLIESKELGEDALLYLEILRRNMNV